VQTLPWVSKVVVGKENGHSRWSITVNDDIRARQELLRIILQDGKAQILEFGRRKYELEEVFMNLISEGS
jgi:ABC-2 type transport system ATP-binding protein